MSYEGSCLCNTVRYRVHGRATRFYTCHCTRCQKESGSAFAANLFHPTESMEWISGKDQVTRFELADADRFCSDFCSRCGSIVPYLSRGHEFYIVPAGSIDGELDIRPIARIFWKDRPCWVDEAMKAESYDGYWELDEN